MSSKTPQTAWLLFCTGWCAPWVWGNFFCWQLSPDSRGIFPWFALWWSGLVDTGCPPPPSSSLTRIIGGVLKKHQWTPPNRPADAPESSVDLFWCLSPMNGITVRNQLTLYYLFKPVDRSRQTSRNAAVCNISGCSLIYRPVVTANLVSLSLQNDLTKGLLSSI